MSQALDSNAAKFHLELGSYDEDELKVLRFSSTEGVSELFALTLEIGVRDELLDVSQLVGEEAHFHVRTEQGAHALHGLCISATFTGMTRSHACYSIVIAPKAWKLTARTNCRVFQGMRTKEIITAVFNDHGISSNEISLDVVGETALREYCVQYRETDFAFVSRLMEDEGLFYYFRSDGTKSVMVVSNKGTTWPVIDGDDELEYAESSGMLSEGRRAQVFDLRVTRVKTSNGYATRGYDIGEPHQMLAVSVQTDAGDLEVFEPLERYSDSSAGEAIRDLRFEAVFAGEIRVEGNSSAMALRPGYAFELTKHPIQTYDGDYHVLRVARSGESPQALEEEAGAAGGGEFTVSFSACPAEVVHRPACTTPRPLVEGTQLALVVGSNNAEIETDTYGRVKVMFRWDRYAPGDETSSCWIRVAQPWAGSDFGFLAIPRVGQEVLVDFLDGDPDLPIIVGSVYNGEQMPPQTLAEQKSRSTWRSRSLGGSGGFNEITLDDKENGEEFYLHAERNLRERVKNDRSRSVGANESVEVVKDEERTVGENQALSVGKDRVISVGGDQSNTTSGKFERVTGVDEERQVGGKRTTTVGKDVLDQFGKTFTRSVLKDVTERAGESRTLETVANDTHGVGGSWTRTVTGEVDLTSGKKTKIEAANEIELVCGRASLKLKKDGTIELSGVNVTIKGSGKVEVQATGQAIIKGSMIKMN